MKSFFLLKRSEHVIEPIFFSKHALIQLFIIICTFYQVVRITKQRSKSLINKKLHIGFIYIKNHIIIDGSVVDVFSVRWPYNLYLN